MELLCDQCSTACLKLNRGFERVRKGKKRKLYVREREKSDGESGGGGGSISENTSKGIALNSKIFAAESSTKPISGIYKCPNCKLVQLLPRVSDSQITDSYTSSNSENFHNPSTYRIKSFKRAMSKLKKISLSDISTVCDIGCASGEFLSSISDKVETCIGIEPNKNLGAIARSDFGLEIFTGTLTTFNSKTKFDLVTMWDVLEHVVSPKATLEKLDDLFIGANLNETRDKQAMEGKRKKYLILNLPMIDTLPARLLGSFWPFYLEVHIYYFTLRTIKLYTQELGFELIEQKRYWQTLPLRYLMRRYTANSLNWVPNIPVKYYLGQRTLVFCKYV
jgi:hypothetical protein